MGTASLRWGVAVCSLAVLLPACSRQQAPAAPPAGMGMGRMDGGATDSPLVGKTAPDFALPTHAGGKFSLKEARAKGPVLLYFYKGVW